MRTQTKVQCACVFISIYRGYRASQVAFTSFPVFVVLYLHCESSTQKYVEIYVSVNIFV